MSDSGSNIGPSSTRGRIALLIALIGTVFVGSLLARAWPRSVEVAYTLGPGVTELDIDYLQEGQPAASARFRGLAPETPVVRHTVRLQPGEYQARITLYGPGSRGTERTKVLIVPSPGLTRFDLREATVRSE